MSSSMSACPFHATEAPPGIEDARGDASQHHGATAAPLDVALSRTVWV